MPTSWPPWAVVLAIVASLILLLVLYLAFASRRTARQRSARDAELAERGSVLGLAPVPGPPEEVIAGLRPAALLPEDSSPKAESVLGGRRGDHEVTFFDYTWNVHGSPGRWAGRPVWNPERNDKTRGGTPVRTCALAVAAVATKMPLPEFLLEPNPVLPLRENSARALAALEGRSELAADERVRMVASGPFGGVLHDLLEQAEARAGELPEPPGLHFDERPDFYAQIALIGGDEPALRRLFRPELLDFFLARPGWLVNSVAGHVLVSVELGHWPPTRESQRHLPFNVTRWLPPEHLTALVDGALEIVRKVEAAAT
jgi:hypothetical protein